MSADKCSKGANCHFAHTPEELIQDTEDRRDELYKTELCKNIEYGGTCKFGAACWFAHSLREVRPKPPVSKDPSKPDDSMTGIVDPHVMLKDTIFTCLNCFSSKLVVHWRFEMWSDDMLLF